MIKLLSEEYICCIFDEDDPQKAYEDAKWETVRYYGKTAICNNNEASLGSRLTVFHKDHSEEYMKPLYQFDAGDRTLCRCCKCRGLVLIHDDEFHDIYRRDIEFTRIVPVRSIREADRMCSEDSEYLGLHNLNKLMRPQLEYSYEDYGSNIYKWIHTNKAI